MKWPRIEPQSVSGQISTQAIGTVVGTVILAALLWFVTFLRENLLIPSWHILTSPQVSFPIELSLIHLPLFAAFCSVLFLLGRAATAKRHNDKKAGGENASVRVAYENVMWMITKNNRGQILDPVPFCLEHETVQLVTSGNWSFGAWKTIFSCPVDKKIYLVTDDVRHLHDSVKSLANSKFIRIHENEP
jgi:hypothetical protein